MSCIPPRRLSHDHLPVKGETVAVILGGDHVGIVTIDAPDPQQAIDCLFGKLGVYSPLNLIERPFEEVCR